MSLQSRLSALITAIGSDIKGLKQVAPFAPVTAVGGSSINSASPPATWGPYTPAAGDRVLITSGPTPGIWIFQAAGVAMVRAVDDLGASNPRGKLVPVLDNNLTAAGLYMVYAPNSFFATVVEPYAKDQHAISTATQSGFAADQMVAGSVVTVPLGRIKEGTKYRCRFNVSKTAAGVASAILNLRMGTLGTVADASRTLHTYNPQTAAADFGQFEIEAIFRGTVLTNMGIQALATLSHWNSVAGLNTLGPVHAHQAVATAFNPQVQSKIGVSLNGGASAAYTIQMVSAELVNLA